ncbi:hypothetical protein FI667_g16207, partial [Globisporangium splendens]
MKITSITSFLFVAAIALGQASGALEVDFSQLQTTTGSTPAPTTVKPGSTPTSTTTKPASTPASTTGKAATAPASTTVKPATTPVETTSKSTSATPAPTTAKTASNPAAANSDKKCVDVSVEGDATYCITGPVCSGGGKAAPAGVNCPQKGDVAVEACIKTLKSYTDGGKCVASVDAECKVIKTNVWGCVWKESSTAGVAMPSTTSKASTTPSPAIFNCASTPSSTSSKTTTAPATAPAATTSKGATVAPAPTTVKPANTPAATTAKDPANQQSTSGK